MLLLAKILRMLEFALIFAQILVKMNTHASIRANISNDFCARSDFRKYLRK